MSSNLAVYTETAQVSDLGMDDIVTKHATLVKRIAYHLMSRLPACVQVDDLIQSGMIGLLEAGRNYDPAQGASFETYAGIRIRGSMLDEIRKGDWAPRSLHRKVREISKAIREIEGEQGRDAKDAEVAERLELSLTEYHQVLQDANSHHILSFEDLPSKDSGLIDGLSAKIAGPLESLIDEDTRELLAKAIDTLPERERMVMALYYTEELNLREAGEVLGVSESRVCQIHSQALIRIRARVAQIIDGEEWS
ncbi:MAG: RNA polymerase sigma factor for flagellar operon FliA [Planctomycetota bacterium]|jgi:RNA polymerase sigma factor for flagellar operon FliA